MINPVVFQGNAVDSQGNVLSGATISVISVTTGLPVLLYSDLADTGMTNPFNTNASGAFVFYCEAETVNVTATKGASSRTWENQFLNVVSLKNDLKTNPQTVSTPWTFAVPTYMQSPLNISNGIPIYFGSVYVLNGTYNSIPTLKVNNVELLTKNTLSSANNIVDADRAVSNLGWWAIAQENLGTAAFADLTTPSATIFDDGNLKVNTFDCNAVGDFIFPSFGYANSATSISIILPLNMMSPPSGFTMTNGVTAYTLGAGVITGSTKTGADITLSTVSTSRCAAITFSGYTGLTVGSQYIFRASSATSKLEFS